MFVIIFAMVLCLLAVQVGGTKNQTQSALMVNLTKDPDTEQAKFVRKYDCEYKKGFRVGCFIALYCNSVSLRQTSCQGLTEIGPLIRLVSAFPGVSH